MDAWIVDDLPDEADEADIDEARVALADDDEPVPLVVLAAMFDRSPRTVQRWRRNGCEGARAKLIHLIRRLDEEDVEEETEIGC